MAHDGFCTQVDRNTGRPQHASAHTWKVTVLAAASKTGLASCSSAEVELAARSTTTGSLSQRPLRATNMLLVVVLVKAATRRRRQSQTSAAPTTWCAITIIDRRSRSEVTGTLTAAEVTGGTPHSAAHSQRKPGCAPVWYTPVWRDEDEYSATSDTPVNVSLSAASVAPVDISVNSTSAGGSPAIGPGAGAPEPRSPPADAEEAMAGMSVLARSSRAPGAARQVSHCGKGKFKFKPPVHRARHRSTAMHEHSG